MTWIFITRAITRYPIKHTLSLSFTTLHPSLSKIQIALHSTHNNNNNYKIDIVDNDTWQLSTALTSSPFHNNHNNNKVVSNLSHQHPNSDCDLGFDDIDDLRICGKLFYKLDKDSKEYEEYNYKFHKTKSSKTKSKVTKPSENEDRVGEVEPKRNHGIVERRKSDERLSIEKKKRVLTFNQVTGPYHEPFCLDVYVSKGSVRACVVHRATSNVVAVAHSISKDMKFELGSTKSHEACAAVGKVLAQRALADDIHNVVYTPRKGEKLEGKLLSVVQSVINNGVMVKIKLKKKKVPKPGFHSVNYKPS